MDNLAPETNVSRGNRGNNMFPFIDDKQRPNSGFCISSVTREGTHELNGFPAERDMERAGLCGRQTVPLGAGGGEGSPEL